MSRRRKRADDNEQDGQLALDFNTVIQSAKVQSRDQVTGGEAEYSPIDQTAEYMRRAVDFEDAWETTIQKARERLIDVDAVSLYFEFLTDLKDVIERGSPKAARLADLMNAVAVRGFGMTPAQVRIDNPTKGATRWRVHMDANSVVDHLERHIVGPRFLNLLKASDHLWAGRAPLIGSSDVSQHFSSIPVPARFFKRSVPFVLNNAAGALFTIHESHPRYENVFNPKPDDSLLRWMLIDPSYQDELEPEDFRRCLSSAMDVGQYKFDREYLLKADKRRPDVILRDGSLFPSDAYLDNFAIQSKRGEFTREAIIEMLDCLTYAKEVGTVYCGIAKNVQLKMYSGVVDWYIAKNIDSNWEVGSYTLNDGLAMSLLLSTPNFVESNLQQVTSTCLIRRSFTTRADLNTKVRRGQSLKEHLDEFQKKHEDVLDITPYRRLCEIAHLYTFFMGHSKSPQQQLPRYEFFYHDGLGPPQESAQAILGALQHCSLMPDHDHSFMADRPITYLMPSVTQQAHELSKNVGKHIDSMTGQWIMSRYRGYLDQMKKN